MLHFIQTLPPTQVALLLGFASSLLQVAVVKGAILKLRDWTDHHKEVINVITSIVLPLAITIGSTLAGNANFTHIFPHYAETYLAAQAFYYTAIRFTQMVYGWYSVASQSKQSSAEVII